MVLQEADLLTFDKQQFGEPGLLGQLTVHDGPRLAQVRLQRSATGPPSAVGEAQKNVLLDVCAQRISVEVL